jgi:hypothetical protein
VYFSQLAFQGVRRFPASTPRETAYRYYEKPYAWSSNIVVNWSGRLAPGETVMAAGQQFNVPVQDYDFVFHYLALTEQLVGLAPPFNAIQPCNQSIKLMLYDVDRNQLMSAPVCDFLLGYGSRNYNSLFPVPPLVYPAGSQILFDIHSLLRITTLPCNLQITFFGTRRMPC